MAASNRFWVLITSRAFFIVASLAILGIIVGIGNSVWRRLEVEREISALKGDIHKLEGKNEELGRLINYFQTPEFKERSNRLERGLQKPGEQVVVIPGLGQGTGLGTQAAPLASERANWQKWRNYFFK